MLLAVLTSVAIVGHGVRSALGSTGERKSESCVKEIELVRRHKVRENEGK